MMLLEISLGQLRSLISIDLGCQLYYACLNKYKWIRHLQLRSCGNLLWATVKQVQGCELYMRL